MGVAAVLYMMRPGHSVCHVRTRYHDHRTAAAAASDLPIENQQEIP